jgi:hypothetical protein
MATFLELTNELLRKLNEVEITSTDFPSLVGIQATAKDCIKYSINEIMDAENNWSFNWVAGTQLCVQGQVEYELPADCNQPDWESFRIQKDDVLNIQTSSLKLISKDYWYERLRAADEDAGSDGRMVPEMVFMSNEGATQSFGVTPSPDLAYTVNYEYYSIHPELDLYSDTTRIPDRYKYVIIAGALKHFNFFKDNMEQGAFWTNEFQKMLSGMRVSLAPRKDDIRDTRVNFGGPSWRNIYSDTSI